MEEVIIKKMMGGSNFITRLSSVAHQVELKLPKLGQQLQLKILIRQLRINNKVVR